ncbi:hypothetical protein BDK51DRAFT_27727 [Blyttiomyces helicus]|uniref:Uncharacterized protein n=1 Tax=Blyttiomyces helicus TaxID=388810 RepID=A0A4P9W1R3_9FUNG|nr:hypothetical protein BDK51DRAFT_27727 [Blyttiomyces helicus]|eukprot:RKO85622.1 hypothetical protein BDK51DRAFT_27727 [Blyttiomyces helicus]
MPLSAEAASSFCIVYVANPIAVNKPSPQNPVPPALSPTSLLPRDSGWDASQRSNVVMRNSAPSDQRDIQGSGRGQLFALGTGSHKPMFKFARDGSYIWNISRRGYPQREEGSRVAGKQGRLVMEDPLEAGLPRGKMRETPAKIKASIAPLAIPNPATIGIIAVEAKEVVELLLPEVGMRQAGASNLVGVRHGAGSQDQGKWSCVGTDLEVNGLDVVDEAGHVVEERAGHSDKRTRWSSGSLYEGPFPCDVPVKDAAPVQVAGHKVPGLCYDVEQGRGVGI